MPEKTVAEVRTKIERIQTEAEKIGYDAEDKIRSLEKKCQKLEKHEREAYYREALNLPEATLDEILVKIETVKKEGKKIGYPFERDVEAIEKRLDEARKKEADQRRDELSNDVLMTACMNLTKKANRLGIANYFQGIGIVDMVENAEFDYEEILNRTALFLAEMDYPGEEVPILYYDDTLTKNSKDSMLLTDRRLYVANVGQVDSLDLMEVERFTPVEKFLTPHILVNDRYKISVGIAGKKYVQAFIELVRMAVMTGIALRPMRKDPNEDELGVIMKRINDISELSEGNNPSEMQAGQAATVSGEKKTSDTEMKDKLFCRNCGNEINESSKYCSRCGMPVGGKAEEPLRCRKCGNLIKPGKRFCNQCGTSVE